MLEYNAYKINFIYFICAQIFFNFIILTSELNFDLVLIHLKMPF